MPSGSNIDKWRARQRALAGFATHALRGNDLEGLLQRACEHVAEGLIVPIAKIALLHEESPDLLLAAHIGLDGIAEPGRTVLPGGRNSALGYALEIGEPVISDIPTESRFNASEIVRRSGVRTSVNVVMWVEGKPYGGLEADTFEPWQPSQYEIDFLQTYADLVAAAIERTLIGKRLDELSREREVLLREILHRNKNILANVLAISRRTARYSESVLQYRDAFEGRIVALSRAHDLLLSAPTTPALLRELLEMEFRAKGLESSANFRIEGPDLICSPRAIHALALLIFELATNAVKYGALSKSARSDAGIHVRWNVEKTNGKSHVHFIWREHGIGALPSMRRRGFGSELTERLVPGMLDGKAVLNTHEDGIEYILDFTVLNEDLNRFRPLGDQNCRRNSPLQRGELLADGVK
jgi:two-component sensor histidine kinase